LNCLLCPRKCGASRATPNPPGFCGAGAVARVFRHGPHFGEEPPISGERGSGTVFFSHCTMRCLYCQNHPWSQSNRGEDMDVPRLAEVFKNIAEQGCHNWNLVSPTPWLPQIREAHALAVAQGSRRLPLVFNTSGYECVDTLAEYADLADITLCDLRYADNRTAAEASEAPDYVDISRAALSHFWNRLGPLQEDGEGIATRGVIIRVLVLPGHADEAVDNLRWVADHLGTGVHISLMAQYTPAHRAASLPVWNRGITADEYALATDALESLGFENGWAQEHTPERHATLLGEDMKPGHGTAG